MKITNLTKGERLLLKRRRDEKSQRETADDHGVSLYLYRRWETDGDKIGSPSIEIGMLALHEICFIRRKHSGFALGDLAEKLGVSRWWLCKMEYGRANCDRLVAYWAQKDKPWRPTIQAKKTPVPS